MISVCIYFKMLQATEVADFSKFRGLFIHRVKMSKWVVLRREGVKSEVKKLLF